MASTIDVYILNELRGVGCGQRLVTATKIGRKWVRVETSGKSRRISRAVWDILVARAERKLK